MCSSIAIVIPYFGTLPNYYPIWKKSVLKNSTIDFLLFTNDLQATSESNLKVNHMEFEEYVAKLHSVFGDDIVCNKPYKLCDYKPALGFFFKELLAPYDFWGFCDMDMVFGDMRLFITEEILSKYDQIGYLGPLSLYRNVDYMNQLYLDNGEYPEYNWEEVIKTDQSCYFDEFFGMNIKISRNNILFYAPWKVVANIKPNKRDFGKDGKRYIVLWENGKLFSIDENFNRKELLYCHFQKRKMAVADVISNSVLIIPNRILENPSVISNELFQGKGSSALYTLKYYVKKLLISLKRYGILKNFQRAKRKRDIWRMQ